MNTRAAAMNVATVKSATTAGKSGRTAGRAATRRCSGAFESLVADQWHEDHGPIRLLEPFVPVARHDEQLLAHPRPDGDHQARSLGKLLAQRVRHRRCRSGDDDPVPWRAVRCAKRPVADADLDM